MKRLLFLLIVMFTFQNLISQNENFEDAGLTSAVPNTITIASPTSINGWTVNSGSNSGPNGSCMLTGAYTSAPNACGIISHSSAGTIDPIIGASYPIFSVFGAVANNGNSFNSFNCYGDWFIRLNNQTPGGGVQKLSKQIMVTPSNSLFEFAYMLVAQDGHCCCDGPGFALKLKINSSCSSSGSYTTCPQYTLSPPAGAGCSPTGSCTSPGNTNTFFSASTTGWSYTKWKKGVLDLSPFVGTCVTVEVYAMDCQYNGHSGYVYFDAQSSPMSIIVNGNSYPAGTPMISAGTCGAGATATITAPSVPGGYTWTSPGGPGSFTTVPGGQSIITSVSGSHTITMNPPGACSPIIKVLNLMISPAPNMAIPSNTMFSCSNPTLNGVSVIMSSGTATNNPSLPNYTVSFSPAQPSGTIGVSANTGTYTGLVVGVNTITIIDSIGCKATQTINITPAPAISSFSIDSSFGTVVGCSPNSVPLSAVNTNTALSNMTYTWTSSATSPFVGSSINAIAPSGPNTYTVFGSDLTAGSCMVVQMITITSSSAVPGTSVFISTQSLTCNGACKTFTAITSTTTNIIGTWYNSSGPMNMPSSTPMIMCANAPGTYTASFCNVLNGCCSSQTVSVVSNTSIPTISVNVTSSNGFTINCTNPNVVMNISSSGSMAPIGYTWTPLSNPSASTTPAAGGYTATVPGLYEAIFRDGNFCYVSTTVSLSIDTLRPSPTSITNLSGNSYTLNCFTSSLVATAISNPMLPISNYSWTQPSPLLTYPSHTVTVGLSNITSSLTPSVYTLSAMGFNGCIGRQKVSFWKDTFVPTYSLASTPSVITCANPCVAMTPFTTSTVPITFTISSPPPTQTATVAGALMCQPGTYTLNYINQFNGCPGIATAVVLQNLIPPAVINPSPTYYLLCGATTTVISANTVTTSPTYSYSWDGPAGAGMSCLGGTACATPSVNSPGVYNVYILNTANGCSSTNSVLVVQSASLPVSISGNTMICVGEIAVLTGAGATSYTWSTGSNANPIGVSPTVTTTYTLTGEISASTTCTGQNTITILVDPCIGIKELEWSKVISVAPNPSTEKFNIMISRNIENGVVKLTNSIGQEVLKQNVKQGNNEINCSLLAKGIYHYNIYQNKEPVSRGKIIIE